MKVLKSLRAKLQLQRNRRIAGIHQLSSATSFDRYPTLFTAVAGVVSPKRVLSFGCSTGEECATIQKYWPSADVIGVDVNEASLRKARQNHGFAQFHHSKELPNLEKFDLVFAMSVLCRHKDTKDQDDISEIYPFHMFEETIGVIVSCVADGGAIVIFNSNYHFEDTRHYEGFRVLIDEKFGDEGLNTHTRKFSPDGRVLADQQQYSVFCRKDGAQAP